jgi:FMN-dependent oxidoreductase (nitrilotriacetate monooxygenase family)
LQVFHMGWFLSFNATSWNAPWSGFAADEWMKAAPYIDMARSLERAGFDYLMLEDGSFIPDAHRGSMASTLASGLAPKHDPLTLVGLIGQATEHIGIIATITSTFYPPFLAARLMTTLDHLTNGRVGANIVTSHNQRTAQNFGLDAQPEHDLRYEMADEWIQVVQALWGSWEPGAVVMDEETGVFADHTKVHRIDYKGQWYSSRGPLNALPGPQGRPVICQAGASPAGRTFAAKYADTIVAIAGGVEDMREYRSDLDDRLIANGRKPTDCKLLFVVSPVLADTEAEAQEKNRRMVGTDEVRIERGLSQLSFNSGMDFTKFDLDGPVPQLVVNAARSSTERLLRGRDNPQTLRQLLTAKPDGVDVVGTPDSVAVKLGEYMAEVGGDGYLISGAVTRRYISEIADGLAPKLRERGLIRNGYSHAHLRDNLLAF